MKPLTTCALHSPTRAALITGRNHQPVPSGVTGEIATGYDGYTSVIPHGAGISRRSVKPNSCYQYLQAHCELLAEESCGDGVS